MNRCPVPNCGKHIKEGKIMCGPHRRLAFPKFLEAYVHACKALRRTGLSQAELAQYRDTRKQAAALAFASVCERLGIDVKELMRPPARANQIQVAVKQALNG